MSLYEIYENRSSEKYILFKRVTYIFCMFSILFLQFGYNWIQIMFTSICCSLWVFVKVGTLPAILYWRVWTSSYLCFPYFVYLDFNMCKWSTHKYLQQLWDLWHSPHEKSYYDRRKLGHIYSCTAKPSSILQVEKALKSMQYDRKYTIRNVVRFPNMAYKM
jgi:hypothetical protein